MIRVHDAAFAIQSDASSPTCTAFVCGEGLTPSSSAMSAQKQVNCDCGRVIREPSDEQLVASVQKHAKEVHDMDLSREQMLSMAELV